MGEDSQIETVAFESMPAGPGRERSGPHCGARSEASERYLAWHRSVVVPPRPLGKAGCRRKAGGVSCSTRDQLTAIEPCLVSGSELGPLPGRESCPAWHNPRPVSNGYQSTLGSRVSVLNACHRLQAACVVWRHHHGVLPATLSQVRGLAQ